MSRFTRIAVIMLLSLAMTAEAGAASRGVTVGIEADKAKAARKKAETEAQNRRQTFAKQQALQQARQHAVAARRAHTLIEERRRAADIQAAIKKQQAPSQTASTGHAPGTALANYKKWVANRPHWQTFQGVVPASELKHIEPARELPVPPSTPCRDKDGKKTKRGNCPPVS